MATAKPRKTTGAADPAAEAAPKLVTVDYRIGSQVPKWIREVIDESFAIEAEDAKKAGALGFMARALVNATLPYKDPKSPIFERRNGDYVLRMIGGNENGLPYGVYPRLLISWLTTEAVRTQSREIELGESLSYFLHHVLGVSRGGGPRGANVRVSEQMERLFSTLITAGYSGGSTHRGFNLRNVMIVDSASLDPDTARMLDEAAEAEAEEAATPEVESSRLWTPQNREDAGRWKSRVVLSPQFFREIIERPVPLDLRAYKVLRGSPVAMDLYSWLTYRMSYLTKSTRPVPWEALMLQFGSGYSAGDELARVREFRNKSFKPALKVVQQIYPQARIEVTERGLILHPSKPHIPYVASKPQGDLF